MTSIAAESRVRIRIRKGIVEVVQPDIFTGNWRSMPKSLRTPTSTSNPAKAELLTRYRIVKEQTGTLGYPPVCPKENCVPYSVPQVIEVRMNIDATQDPVKEQI